MFIYHAFNLIGSVMVSVFRRRYL